MVQCELVVGFRAWATLLNPRRRNTVHAHPVWQLEIITESQAMAVVPPEPVALAQGDCILIPPDVPHRFVYQELPVRWATFRFGATGASTHNRVQKLPMTPLNTCIRDALLHVMPRSLAAPASPDGRVAASLLAALLQHNSTEEALAPPGIMESRIVREISGFLRRHAKGRLVIEDLARHCGYSADYLSKKFKAETGVGLKEFIDQERCRMAENLLAHTNLSVSEIAYDVGFNDIYGFSRFFKRVNGSCPTGYRAGFLLEIREALTGSKKRNA